MSTETDPKAAKAAAAVDKLLKKMAKEKVNTKNLKASMKSLKELAKDETLP